MKSYYIVYDSMNLDKPDGVEKKIIYQKEMFSLKDMNMTFLILNKAKGSFWNYRYELEDADFIYFRKGTTIDWRFIHFFKRLKKNNSKVVIFMEIPTYPYDGEGTASISRRIVRSVDHFFRQRIHPYIDRLIIVNYHEPTLWGITAVNLINGIDIKNIKKRIVKNYSRDSLTICCIAKFSPWHGYERIIRGLSLYYANNGTRDIKILMVGSGVEEPAYRQLVAELRLEEKIKFYGQLVGTDLEEIYNISDVGCCSLGRYKSGINMTSELKSREYMAKGMPMICGCKIDVLENIQYPYAIFFKNDDSDINIWRVIEFMDNLYSEKDVTEVSEEIRNFAEIKVDMVATFDGVVREAEKLI